MTVHATKTSVVAVIKVRACVVPIQRRALHAGRDRRALVIPPQRLFIRFVVGPTIGQPPERTDYNRLDDLAARGALNIRRETHTVTLFVSYRRMIRPRVRFAN